MTKSAANIGVLHGLMDVFSTAIFYAFHLIFTTEFTQYVGRLVGFFICWRIDQQLDRRYFFIYKINKNSEAVLV